MPAPFWGRLPELGYEGAVYATSPDDQVSLGGDMLPGICQVDTLPEHVYERQKVDGRDGATLTMRGYLPGPIDIECLIWTQEQWNVLQGIIAKVWRKPGKLAAVDSAAKKTGSSADAAVAEENAIDIQHYGLQVLGVSRVVIKGISPPKKGPKPQSRVVHFKCLEFVPSPKAQKTARVSGSAAQLKPVADFLTPRNGLGPKPSTTDGSPLGPPPPGARGGH